MRRRCSVLSDAIAAHADRDAVSAAGVVDEKLAALGSNVGVPSAHGGVVRENPIARFTADG